MTDHRTFSAPTHPGPAKPELSQRYSRQRRLGTAPEMQLRRALHALGLRYRVGVKVPGRPRRTIDIAFPAQRLAVFVDGCFWHGCPEHGVRPKSNSDWWNTKLTTNQARDGDTDAVLEAAGWSVVRVWEHQVPHPATDVVRQAHALCRASSR